MLHEKNLELENANLARLNMLIELGQELAAEHDPTRILENFCRSARQIVEAHESGVGILNGDGTLRYFFRCASAEENGASHAVPPTAQWALDTLMAKRRPLRLGEADDLLHSNENASGAVHSFLGVPEFTAGWVWG